MEDKIFKTLAEVKNLYPEDIARIDAEGETIKKALLMKGYTEHEGSKILVEMCREQIIFARKKLATDRDLVGNEAAQRDLWLIIDSRSWILSILTKDYNDLINGMYEQLKADLGA